MTLKDFEAAVAALLTATRELAGEGVKVFVGDSGDTEDTIGAALNEGLVLVVRIVSGDASGNGDPNLQTILKGTIRIGEMAIINRTLTGYVTARQAVQVVSTALHFAAVDGATLTVKGFVSDTAKIEDGTELQIAEVRFEADFQMIQKKEEV